MKNKSVLATFLLSCALLAACGKKEPLADSPYQGLTPGADLASFTERTEYYDITVNSDDLFDLDLWDKNPPDRTAEVAALMGGKGYLLLGTQFCRGEPVQLWAELSSKGSDIYLYRKDGTSRRLLQGISSSYTASGALGYQWYIDRDGDLYCYRSISYVQTGKKDKVESSIAKFLSTGEVLYTVMLESDAWIEDFCQTEDGGVYLLLKDSENSSRFLAQLDPSTGKLDMASRIKIPLEFGVYLGSAGDFPVVTGSSSIDPDNRVAKVNTSDGSLIPILFFTGTSYGWRKADLQDIQVVEDGYDRLIAPAIEREIRGELTERAEEGAIKVFGKNLHQLLMQPPITGKVVLGWDPAFRTGCKLAVVDETGKVLDTVVIYPTAPQNKVTEAKAILKKMSPFFF